MRTFQKFLQLMAQCLLGAAWGLGSLTWCHATAPSGTDKTFSVLSNSTTTLIPADWGFSDSYYPHDTFSAVKLTTLPASGTLKVDGINAALGEMVSVQLGPSGAIWCLQENAGNHYWNSITSSADGSKLAAVTWYGQIYTSSDSGENWIPQESGRDWWAITSSSDGSKLAAVESIGHIYTSSDYGFTWTPRESSRYWEAITSSADGSKLAAVVRNGHIYTSVDSGATWLPRESSRYWEAITSSADGSKLAAVVSHGQIYTSSDFGVTWVPREAVRPWRLITSSSDGSKLAAAVRDGQIYTSTDSGVTWTPRETDRNWRSIACSADGSTLAAVVEGGQIHISMDWGVSWTPRESNRDWSAITCSADGSKLAAAASFPFGGIYTSTRVLPAVTYTAPVGTGSASFTFQVQDSAGTNNLDLSPNTLTFNHTSTPPAGMDKTVYMLANSTRTLNAVDWGFSDSDTPPDTFAAVKLTSLPASGSLRVDGVNATTGQTIFLPTFIWTPQPAAGTRIWHSITSSADGSKLAAVVYGGQIYTSTDSGATWTPRESNRWWTAITSSADGSKLAAAVYDGQIYTSTDSGVNWAPREGYRGWSSITSSSADGSKLAAIGSYQIYTSSDSGATWTPRGLQNNWSSITSSADGSKLAAVAEGGHIHTSTDSGMTWTLRESIRNWSAITSSADGGKLAAVVKGGQIFTSTDSGVSWLSRDSDRNWLTITSSADGSKLAAGVDVGHIYVASAVNGATITYTAPPDTDSASFTFQVQDSAAMNNLDLSPNTLVFNFASSLNPSASLPTTPPGGWPINPVTGLYDIDVPVQNTTASIINGFRLSVDLGSHPSLVLSNHSSPGGATPAYVDYDYPVGIGQAVTQRLSFALATGVMPNPFTPALSVSTLSPSTAGGPLPGGLSFSSTAIQPNSGGPFLLTWPSTAGRFYRIYYTHDFSTWFPCGLPVQAISSQSQWSDTGPPYTTTLPGMARFYKVSEIAAP